jgi:hypothetical protein
MKNRFFLSALAVLYTSGFPQVDWVVNPTPVLSTSFDPSGAGAYAPMVLAGSGGYKMWYTRTVGQTDENIAYATSADGLAWTLVEAYDLIPEVGGSRFDSRKKLGQASVMLDGATYKMWYWGNGPFVGNIGYATSVDGQAWTKFDGTRSGMSVYDRDADGSGTPALTTPTVLKDGNTYKMWYSRYNLAGTNIGYATSPDGTTWTNVAGPLTKGAVLDIGGPEKFDEKAVLFPTVIKSGNKFLMWYTGIDFFDVSHIGHATSPDGINWTRVDGKAAMGSCIGAGTSPSVSLVAGMWKMWFSAEDGIHIATSDPTVGILDPKTSDQGILGRNHLSPFNSWSEISYSIEGSSFVSLVLFDTEGNKIKTLVSGHQSAGSYSVPVSLSDLPKGVYVYQLKVGSSFADAKKLIVR